MSDGLFLGIVLWGLTGVVLDMGIRAWGRSKHVYIDGDFLSAFLGGPFNAALFFDVRATLRVRQEQAERITRNREERVRRYSQR